jgi:hypothetical protein
MCTFVAICGEQRMHKDELTKDSGRPAERCSDEVGYHLIEVDEQRLDSAEMRPEQSP